MKIRTGVRANSFACPYLQALRGDGGGQATIPVLWSPSEEVRVVLSNSPKSRRGSVAPGLFREAAKRTLPSVWGAVAILCGLGIAFCWGCM